MRFQPITAAVFAGHPSYPGKTGVEALIVAAEAWMSLNGLAKANDS